MKIFIIAFTNSALNLAKFLNNYLNAEIYFKPKNLYELTGKIFTDSDAIIFISACGIAVRAISKYINSKLTDPAVIVIDEKANYVIPILSGHIGGANELARNIAKILNAQPVITTATDLNNLIAVDEWAVNNNCNIENPELIKNISGALLENKNKNKNLKIGVAVTEQNINLKDLWPVTLILRPKNLILGAGCKKNIDPDLFENSALKFLENSGVSYLSLKILASIDIKKHEPAMINFARKYKIDFVTFSADELNNLNGSFTDSERVKNFIGVGNVCERSAILAAGNKAALLRSKFIINNITFALARGEF